MRQNLDVGTSFDKLPIRMENVELAFKPDAAGQRAFNSSGFLEILQGQMVSLVGPKGEGKSTMLKSLAASFCQSQVACSCRRISVSFTSLTSHSSTAQVCSKT